MSACASCGAPVRWAMTTKGRRMPLDLDPRDDGNITVAPQPGGFDRATVWGNSREGMPPGPRYVSHFATCSAAARHRRRR